MTDGFIIGIHGLRNKPPKLSLETRWREAIEQSLSNQVNLQDCFALAYWADIFYDEPLPDEDWRDRAEFERGSECIEIKAERSEDETLYKEIKYEFERICLNFGEFDKKRFCLTEGLAREFVRVRFEDLDKYYHHSERRSLIRQRLVDVLNAHRHQRIALVSHSMGTIIAYDVLRALSVSDEQFQVEHFVSIGSPLGVPYVKLQINEEFGGEAPIIPSNLKQWSNISDRFDQVCLDSDLGDEYLDPRQRIKIRDIIVHNEFRDSQGNVDPHSVYGYLRAKEMSLLLEEFLGTRDAAL